MSCQSYSGVKPQLDAGVTVQPHTYHSHIQEYATAIHNVTVQSHICHSHIHLHHSHICYASHIHYTGVKPQPHAGVTVVTHMPQSHSGVKPQLYAGVTVTHMPVTFRSQATAYAGVTVTVTHVPQSHSGVEPQLYAGVTVTVTHMPYYNHSIHTTKLLQHPKSVQQPLKLICSQCQTSLL